MVCCCVRVKAGDIDSAKLLAEEAKRNDAYDDRNVFDCGYVQKRVAAYGR